MKLLLCLILTFNYVFANTNNRLNDIDERLTDLELKTLGHNINFGFDLFMSVGALKTENVNNSGKTYRDILSKNTFRFKIDAAIANNFKVYATYQTVYFFNNELGANRLENNDIFYPSRGSSPYLRTAYFDWSMNDYLVFSGGRLPTTLGPPVYLYDGRQRTGTYPVTSYNVPFDGFSLTVKNLKFSNTEVFLRTVWAPGANTNDKEPEKGTYLQSNDLTRRAKPNMGITQMIEVHTQPAHTSLLKDLLFILQYSYFKLGSFTEADGPGQIVSAIPAYGISDDRNIYRYRADNETLAINRLLTLYLQAEDVFSTNFDFYYSYEKTEISPVANVVATVIQSGHAATPNNTKFNLGTSLADKEVDGTRSLYGLRYGFSSSYLGFEYWKTKDYSLPNDTYSDDILGAGRFLGESFHGYYTHMFFNNNVSLRLGAIKINEDKFFYTNATRYSESNQKISMFYTSLYVSY